MIYQTDGETDNGDINDTLFLLNQLRKLVKVFLQTVVLNNVPKQLKFLENPHFLAITQTNIKNILNSFQNQRKT